jgi:hypothetical protein
MHGILYAAWRRDGGREMFGAIEPTPASRGFPSSGLRSSRGWRFQNDIDDLALIEVGLFERHDYLDLNRGTAGQLGNTDTGPRMGAAFLANSSKTSSDAPSATALC